MKVIAIFFIISFAILEEFYLVNPMLSFGNISLLVIIYLTFVNKKQLIIQNNLLSYQDQNRQKKIIFSYLIFIFYIFLIDFFRGEYFPAIRNILLQFGSICCLPLFNYFYYNKKYDFLKWLYFLIIVQLIFVLLQLNNFQINITDIMPKNFLIGAYEKVQYYTVYERVTGAGASAIHLAMQAMMFIIVVIGGMIKKKELKNSIFLLIAIFILLNTQTRASIFALIPSVTICYYFFFHNKAFLKKIIITLILFTIIIFVSFNLNLKLESLFPYIFKEINLGDTHRLYTNFYIAIGVLQESPIFGISREMAWNIFEQYADVDYNVYSNVIKTGTTPTHHNQILFFFRYYGLIGLALFLIVYLRLFVAIKSSKDKVMAFIVGSFFLLDLIFSMTHNNKIYYPFLWIFLALIFPPLKKVE